MKKELNKWQVVFYIGRDWQTMERGWKWVKFGVFKLSSFPEEGYELSSSQLKGFIFTMKVWFPIDDIRLL